VEAAGAFSVVLESIPRELAARITSELRIPTIGIGAGPECDGQILVLHDMIGLSLGHTPKFARRYANVGEAISHAVTAYAEDVREGRFPSDAESYHLSSEVRERLLAVRRS
jgi:3-methyl-2-oxobutanoate hydroxymethyltransferase